MEDVWHANLTCPGHHVPGNKSSYCIPRTNVLGGGGGGGGGILWFSRRYAAASAFHRLRDNFKNPYRICFYILYVD